VDTTADAILGPVTIHGGPRADFDFAYIYDFHNPTAHTYTYTADTAQRDGQGAVTFDSLVQIGLFAAKGGGNNINVLSGAAGTFVNIVAANGDKVVLGSLAPGLGGTLANILYGATVHTIDPLAKVTMIVDDSGNLDTTPRLVTISPPPTGPSNGSLITGLGPTINWQLGNASPLSILGGAGNKVFALQGPLTDVALSIDGGGGSNTLDYAAYTTGVSVNLAAGTATDLAGIAHIQNVIGGSGNDTLVAGADRSILIGGGGADKLVGGSGEDILIGGTTDFTQPKLNLAAWSAILNEWNRTDLGFDDRVSDLMTGANAKGVAALNVVDGKAILLNSKTVHGDLAADTLTGGTGLDWFFIDVLDLIPNLKPGDKVTKV